MANGLWGFGRMLSTAVKNPTRKQGFRRSFSSEDPAPVSGLSYYEEVFGPGFYRLSHAERRKLIDRRDNIEAIKSFSTGFAGGLVIGSPYCYLAYGWYPFKKEIEEGIQAMISKR